MSLSEFTVPFLKVIAQLYDKYAKKKIVGGPIDGIEIKP
jgi:hypothetical protein